MPLLLNRPPQYRKHRASGQAIVTLDGKDFYLGLYGSEASRAEYDRRVGEWLNHGRHLPATATGLTQVATTSRIIEWFCKQNDLVQAAVLGLYPEDIRAELPTMIFKRIADEKKI